MLAIGPRAAQVEGSSARVTTPRAFPDRLASDGSGLRVTQNGATPAAAAGPPTAAGEARTELLVRFLCGPGEIAELREAWDDLFERASGASVHLSRHWVDPFLQAGRLRGDPIAITVWRGPRLVALLPLSLRRTMGIRIAEPIGTGVPSYLGLLLDPDQASAVDALTEACRSARSFDLLSMQDVFSADEPTRLLVESFRRHGAAIRRVKRSSTWRILLGESFDDYLRSQKSGRSRQTLRRKERRLTEAGQTNLQRFDGPEISPEIVDRIFAIQGQSWIESVGGAVLGSAFHRSLIASMAEQGLAQAWLLSIDGDDAAFVLTFRAHGVLHYAYPAYKLEYANLSVGQLLTQHMIRDACETGISLFDFGHSDADYKRYWGNEEQQVDRVFVALSARAGAAAFLLANAWTAIRNPRIKRALRSGRRLVEGLRGSG
jgi:CelD/BcsL family acetyltransferase involved in cellulose biosynthesis